MIMRFFRRIFFLVLVILLVIIGSNNYAPVSITLFSGINLIMPTFILIYGSVLLGLVAGFIICFMLHISHKIKNVAGKSKSSASFDMLNNDLKNLKNSVPKLPYSAPPK